MKTQGKDRNYKNNTFKRKAVIEEVASDEGSQEDEPKEIVRGSRVTYTVHGTYKRRWMALKPNTDHPKLNIKLSQGHKQNIAIEAMIDSGSAITTISPKTVKELGLEMTSNENGIKIRNADGTLMKGGWKENVRAWVDTGVTQGQMDLAVVETHND